MRRCAGIKKPLHAQRAKDQPRCGVGTAGARLCSCRPSWGGPWTALEFLPLTLLCALFILKNPVMTKACSRGKCCVRKGFFFLKRAFLLLLSGPTPPSPKSVKTFKVARTKHRYLK